MKRLLALLGIFALLSTVFVLATASPSSAGLATPPSQWEIENVGEDAITVTSLTGSCNPITKVPFDIPAGQSVFAQFAPSSPDCDAAVVAQDADLQCIMRVPKKTFDGRINTETRLLTPPAVFNTRFDRCVSDNDIFIDKDIEEEQRAQGSLTTFGFTATPWMNTIADGADTTSPCAESGGSASTKGRTESPYSLSIEVLNGYVDVAENKIISCYYGVFETVPDGWALDAVSGSLNEDPDAPCVVNGSEELAVVLVSPQGDEVAPAEEEAPYCYTDFDNSALPVPIIVTKTFIGRSYYTTVDRADFHVFTPGNCSGIPIDPFGNLLGSNGLFRTVNAAQDTQYVIAPPFTSDALPHAFAWTAQFDLKDEAVKCTTRVQETHAPDGCTPLDPTGSNADGPYWEQTWDVGVTNLTFNIVNDCTEPTPEPTVAPTTDPKKPGAGAGAKKPSGGGSTAPKFTG